MQAHAREPLHLHPLLSSCRASVLEAAHAEILSWEPDGLLEFFNGHERHAVSPDIIGEFFLVQAAGDQFVSGRDLDAIWTWRDECWASNSDMNLMRCVAFEIENCVV